MSTIETFIPTKGLCAILPVDPNKRLLVLYFVVVLLVLVGAVAVQYQLGQSLSAYEQETHDAFNQIQIIKWSIMALLFFALSLPALIVFKPLINRLKLAHEQLEFDHNHDYLTGLNNRRSFDVLAKHSIALSQRYQANLSLLHVDIDYFKSINDQYGLEVGDRVIQAVADQITQHCRKSDQVFRFSSTEFIVLLPQTDSRQALKVGNKIREKVLSSPIQTSKLVLEVSISGGVTQWSSSESDLNPSLKRADHALQHAKSLGHNQVQVANTQY